MKNNMCLAALLMLLALVGSAMAVPTQVIFENEPYEKGEDTPYIGEITMTVVNGAIGHYAAGTSSATFKTFCLEAGEIYHNQTPYYAVVNTGAISGGTTAGFDELSPVTAWLYSQYVTGDLADYGFAYSDGMDVYGMSTMSDREYSAFELQKAIWYSEGEISRLTSPLALQFYNAAMQQDLASVGNVRVLNIYATDGADPMSNPANYRQDVLVMVQAPVPGASLLSMLGVGMVVRFRRRLG